ncbi:hypothetical protein SARC_11500, partial [Sphaeroforma arctica JP610]
MGRINANDRRTKRAVRNDKKDRKEIRAATKEELQAMRAQAEAQEENLDDIIAAYEKEVASREKVNGLWKCMHVMIGTQLSTQYLDMCIYTTQL